MTKTENSAPKKPKRGSRNALILAGAVGAVLAAGVATHAFSHGGMGKGMRHFAVEAGHYGNMVHKARFFDRRPKTVEDAQKRAERMAKHFSIEVDATSEQTDKLVELARGAAGDVFPIRRSTKEVRKEGIEILSAETVDRARLEEIRTEQFAKFETISKRLTTALADAAEVLNPEQRKALAERAKEWRGWRGGRGWRGHGPGKHRPWHD